LLPIPFDIRSFFSETFSKFVIFKKISSFSMYLFYHGQEKGERFFSDLVLPIIMIMMNHVISMLLCKVKAVFKSGSEFCSQFDLDNLGLTLA
jgi:hypothetical protein